MSLVDLGKRLLEAAKRGDTDEVRTLMSNGAPFTTDWLGTSPLHFASQFGHSSTAEVLLRAGISRDARTKVDRTPLHVASQEGHIDIVELLIRNGADIEAKDMLKMTPLHWAVEKGNIEVVQALLKQGADVTSDNKFDKTPLEISISNGRTDIAQLLQLLLWGQASEPADYFQSQTSNTVEVMSGEPEVIEEVTTSPTVMTGSLQQVVSSASPITIAPNVHTKMVTASGEEVVVSSAAGHSGLTESTDQSSTSVLATLAALAEATGPLNTSNNTTAAEALNWLETHGITMISSNDAPAIVSSQFESGQTLTLTEAGKLALNLVKQESLANSGETEVVEETVETLDNVVTDEDGQRVIAIVEDQSHLSDGSATVMVVADPDGETIEETVDGSEEPDIKRMRLEQPQESLDLKRQLEEVQRKAEEYKAQLQEKVHEAEVYKKQLNEISGKSST